MLSTSPRHPPHPNANGHDERHYDSSYSYSVRRTVLVLVLDSPTINKPIFDHEKLHVYRVAIVALHSRIRLRSRFVVISGTSETNGCEQRSPSR